MSGPQPSPDQPSPGLSRGPRDPLLRSQWRAARRAVARAHHPDVGGEAETLQRELAAVDRRFADRPADPSDGLTRSAPPAWQPTGRLVRRSRRTLRRRVRALRARLPRGWPGSRRYFDL